MSYVIRKSCKGVAAMDPGLWAPENSAGFFLFLFLFFQISALLINQIHKVCIVSRKGNEQNHEIEQ